LEDIAEGRRCAGSLTDLWSTLIGSVCMEVERIGATRSPLVWVDTVLVPGGRIGALGDEGADVGACMAIEGTDIGAGGGGLVGFSGTNSGSIGESVCVAVDTSWV
jgi:hypothetical protein